MANHKFFPNIKLKLIKNLTSEGIAQRFIEKFENIIFKIEETGDWRFYSGGYFKEISKSKIDGKIIDIIKSIPEEAQGEKYLTTENGEIVDPKTLHAFRDEAINSNSIRKNVISLISSCS